LKLISLVGESFFYYHPDIKKTISVNKFNRKLLVNMVSNDSNTLLNHVETSLKIWHYLKNEKEGKNCKNDFYLNSK